MDQGQSKKRAEAGGQTFPAQDPAAVLPLEPGTRPLGLVPTFRTAFSYVRYFCVRLEVL